MKAAQMFRSQYRAASSWAYFGPVSRDEAVNIMRQSAVRAMGRGK